MLIRLILLLVILNTLDQAQGSVKDDKASLYVHEITEGDFEVYWIRTDYGSTNNYKVIVNQIDGCDATEFEVLCTLASCTFALSDHCSPTSPCTDVTIKVEADTGINSEELKFDTAPHVQNLDTLICEINGTVATVSWNSENLTNEDSKCATKARVQVKISGSGDSEFVKTENGKLNIVNVELDPCTAGEVIAKVTYVSGINNDETSAKNDVTADKEFPGVGIEDPPQTTKDICSIQASWYSACNADYYYLTWNGIEGIVNDTHSSDTSYVIVDLKPGSYNVCVSSYNYDNTLVGEVVCSNTSVEIEQVSPGATVIDKFGLESDSSEELTVNWTGPDSHGCAIVDNFNITWKKAGENSIIGTHTVSSKDTSYKIINLIPSTWYKVEIKAVSDVGTGIAGYKNATTTGGTNSTTSTTISPGSTITAVTTISSSDNVMIFYIVFSCLIGVILILIIVIGVIIFILYKKKICYFES